MTPSELRDEETYYIAHGDVSAEKQRIMEMPPGREMDSLIQSLVFGNTIVGNVDGWNEGGWSIFREQPNGEPAYLKQCRCKQIDELYASKTKHRAALRTKAYGHDVACLDVVPEYSTSIQDAWLVVAHFQKKFARFELEWVESSTHRPIWLSCMFEASGETAPLCICRAALLSLEASK